MIHGIISKDSWISYKFYFIVWMWVLGSALPYMYHSFVVVVVVASVCFVSYLPYIHSWMILFVVVISWSFPRICTFAWNGIYYLLVCIGKSKKNNSNNEALESLSLAATYIVPLLCKTWVVQKLYFYVLDMVSTGFFPIENAQDPLEFKYNLLERQFLHM